MMRGQGLQSSGSGHEEAVEFCEYGNESSVFINYRYLPDKLKDC